MRIVVNKHWQVYLDFGRAGSLCFTVILNLPMITAFLVNSHDLPTVPVYKKSRIASLLCIFETTIYPLIQWISILQTSLVVTLTHTHAIVKVYMGPKPCRIESR